MTGKTYQKVLLDKKEEFLEALGSNCQELAGAEDRLGADADKIAHDDFVLLQVNESLYTQLRQVEDALKRLELGDYGRCLGCGGAIPLKRLQAIPWARFCVDCQDAARGFPIPEMSRLENQA